MPTQTEITDEGLAKVLQVLEGPDGVGDIEQVHIAADIVLVELVRGLGYVKTAEAFEKLTKWYS